VLKRDVKLQPTNCSCDLEKPCAEIWKFFTGVHLRMVTGKNMFWHLGQNPWGDFPHFSYVSVHCGLSLIFHVSSR